MKKTNIRDLILVVLIACLPFLMAADSAKANVWGNVLLIFSPLLAVVASKLTAKLFKKLDIDVEDSILEGIFAQLFRLIAGVEKKMSNMSGEERFAAVVSQAHAKLSKKNIALLTKRFGSVENAVQAAFEQSSVALKPTRKGASG